ncbi:MAG: hypothetical protein K2P88_08900 [Chitinophagaceae bacterium]|uniref:hypothetical protein n=1 Tax=unclassified Paraflavitalea TaxID=2798305 RepID=UPI003D331845|nr:hypothetical protein [Chitinophagaceae bacterium]
MFKKDDFKFGVLLGILAPLLSLVAYYFIRFKAYPVRDVLHMIANNPPMVTAIVIPCLVLNIALFTYYVNTHRDKTMKGIFLVTLVFAIVALILKYVITH